MLKIASLFARDLTFLQGVNIPDALEVKTANMKDANSEADVKMMRVDDVSIFLINLNSNISKPINLHLTKPGWVIKYMLTGQENIYTDKAPHKTNVAEGHYQMLVSNGKSKFNVDVAGVKQALVIYLSEAAIQKILSAEFELLVKSEAGGTKIWHRSVPVSQLMQEVIGKVTDYMQGRSSYTILMIAKMLELLYLSIEQFNITGNSPASSLSMKSDDIDKLQQAKKLIAADLQNPPSLIELARAVGLNDFKLKKGFKELFGTTVFGYLFEIRMEKAKELLISAGQSISEVAHVVGYKNAHHFTAAFKKHFGYLPSKINKA